MTRLLRWILFGPLAMPRIGDDGGGGGGTNSEAEEARKAELRARIDRLYGVGGTSPKTRKVQQVLDEQQPDASGSGVNVLRSVRDVEIPVDTSAFDAEADAAARAMAGEETKLGDATRSYYTDDLGDKYQEAERKKRFALARQGLLGGSEEVNQQGDLRSDRDLGATRVDEAVRRAVTQLRTQREQERLSAVNLVNSGAGDSAVSAAQAGLRNSLDTVSNAQKADLFGDLFTGAADGLSNASAAEREAALASRYRDRLSSFFPTRSTSSGRVTPTS